MFAQAYAAWSSHTQALPFRRNRNFSKGPFELDLDHLIDYAEPILADAVKGSTQIDFPKVAAEYLRDLDQLKAELEREPLGESARQAYLEYLTGSLSLFTKLGSLPTPPDGHLGFR